jgi:hypothetical protein
MDMGVTEVEIRYFHVLCGLGGQAQGFNRGVRRSDRCASGFAALAGWMWMLRRFGTFINSPECRRRCSIFSIGNSIVISMD